MKLFNLNGIAPSAQAILINNGVVNVSSLPSLHPEDLVSIGVPLAQRRLTGHVIGSQNQTSKASESGPNREATKQQGSTGESGNNHYKVHRATIITITLQSNTSVDQIEVSNEVTLT